MNQTDRDFMRAAYAEAFAAAGNSDPNPAVGAVVVSADGAVLATGSTCRAGFDHAERDALNKISGVDLSGATLYVTLEPCCHHGRTPPCTDIILARGIRRVVIAERDYAAEVQGRSVALLREQGVDVSLCDTTDFISERWFTTGSFFFARAHKRPRILLKWAQTLDGALAPATHNRPSGPISGKYTATITALLRSMCKYTLASPGTARIDKPQLTVRFPEMLNASETNGLSGHFCELLRAQHRNAMQTVPDSFRYRPAKSGYLASHEGLHQTLAEISSEGFNAILFEAGPTYSEWLLQNNLVDGLAIYRSKKNTAVSLWGDPGRGNSVSQRLAAHNETLAGFHLMERADFPEDDFFLYRRTE